MSALAHDDPQGRRGPYYPAHGEPVWTPRPKWLDHVACRGATRVFFPEQGESAGPAKAICATCPVISECRADALEMTGWDYGVRGGLTVKERALIRRGQP